MHTSPWTLHDAPYAQALGRRAADKHRPAVEQRQAAAEHGRAVEQPEPAGACSWRCRSVLPAAYSPSQVRHNSSAPAPLAALVLNERIPLPAAGAAPATSAWSDRQRTGSGPFASLVGRLTAFAFTPASRSSDRMLPAPVSGSWPRAAASLLGLLCCALSLVSQVDAAANKTLTDSIAVLKGRTLRWVAPLGACSPRASSPKHCLQTHLDLAACCAEPRAGDLNGRLLGRRRPAEPAETLAARRPCMNRLAPPSLPAGVCTPRSSAAMDSCALRPAAKSSRCAAQGGGQRDCQRSSCPAAARADVAALSS